MGIENCVFPFGEPLHTVSQQDRTKKRVFVLGVYASAVHARWIRSDRKDAVRALAVASEPSIFWRGDEGEARTIIDRININIPKEVGRLVPADKRLNGCSGRALDECILEPLGLSRNDAWLCDLVPYSCLNPQQNAALDRTYRKIMKQHYLPEPTVPKVTAELANEARRNAILSELRDSCAEVLILLGDQPLKWFLSHVDDRRWVKLSNFAQYGQLHEVNIDGRSMSVLPIAHPRQTARLGRSSGKWFDAHRQWMDSVASKLLPAW